jgi:hypothetical protein
MELIMGESPRGTLTDTERRLEEWVRPAASAACWAADGELVGASARILPLRERQPETQGDEKARRCAIQEAL